MQLGRAILASKPSSMGCRPSFTASTPSTVILGQHILPWLALCAKHTCSATHTHELTKTESSVVTRRDLSYLCDSSSSSAREQSSSETPGTVFHGSHVGMDELGRATHARVALSIERGAPACRAVPCRRCIGTERRPLRARQRARSARLCWSSERYLARSRSYERWGLVPDWRRKAIALLSSETAGQEALARQ